MMRLADWRTRLAEYLAQVAHRRYRPGVHDCALFAAGAVQAMTDVDYAAEWQGYRTFRQGKAWLASAGYADHVAVVADYLPEVPVAFAVAGDVAVVPGGRMPALGVVQGEHIYVLTRAGIGLVTLTDAARAFRV